jgi:galactose oxidase
MPGSGMASFVHSREPPSASRPMLNIRRTGRLVLIAALGVLSVTCTGDITPPAEPGGSSFAVAGPATRVSLNRQPPSSALDQEVWAPGSQPTVAVKDAAGVGVSGAVVTAAIASGTGTLQGKLTATTNSNGTAVFSDLGIAGTGSHTLSFTTGSLGATSSTVSVRALPVEASTGKWDTPVDWDIVPLHIHLLPTGKVLAWGKYEVDGSMSKPRLWNPASGAPGNAIVVSEADMLFCSGHTSMADGSILVSGGHLDDNRGLTATNIFDPITESWASGLAKMAKGRWYPTVTTLSDGRQVTVAGRDANGVVVTVPEIWENKSWVRLTGAALSLPYYPRQFVAPNGKIFYAGERIKSRYLDVDATTTSGRGKWTSSSGFSHVYGFNRDYGSAVMYDAGKVLYVGGGGDLGWSTQDPKTSTPTATAEVINLNLTGPRWVSTGSMHHRRRHLNATLLPDGQVLVTGGTSGGGFNDLTSAVHAAEVWNPSTGVWTELAGNIIDRAYHSVSLLMPDGTVLHGASGDANNPATHKPFPRQANHELFRPPYLFRGVRPVISSLSKGRVSYGESFVVSTAYAAQVTGVRWIRLGSVTHAFDAGQRANSLKFSIGSGKVTVTAPASGRLAPPGYYLVFLLNRNGVPSVGQMIRVG